MAGKSRQSANLVSDKNIFVDVTTDNTGIGTTSPKSKLDILGNVNVTGILTVGVTSSVTIDGNTGIISATIFYGNGSNLTGLSAGISSISNYANIAGIATYANRSGIATYASVSGIATYASISGISTYSSLSGVSTYSNTSGFSTTSTYAVSSGISTIASGLTTNTSVNTSGIITASQFSGIFVGDGSGLANVVATGSGVEVRDDGVLVGTARTVDFGRNLNVEFSSGIVTITAPESSYFVKTSAGIHTLSNVGIGTTNPLSALEVFGNVNVSGTSGQLFSVTDNLSTGTIFSVNDISGIPSIEVDADGKIIIANYSGNVGVGTLTPASKLHVNGELTISGNGLRVTNSINNSYVILDSGTGSASGNQTSFIDFRTNSTNRGNIAVNEATSGIPLEINSSVANNIVMATGGGNVGIGIVIPAQKLHVVGNGYFTGSLGIANPNPNLVIGTSHIAIGNFLALYNGLVTTPAPTIPSIRGSTANNLVLSAGNNGAVFINNDNGSNGLFVNAGGASTTWFRIDSTGKVGINTSLPVQNLDVSGTVHISNRIGIGTTNPSQSLQIVGNALVSNTVTANTFIGNLTGTATTAIELNADSNINTTGIITATKFVGDGSGLSGIVATSGGGVFLQNDGITIGAASTINFSNNFAVTSSGGVGLVTITSAPTLSSNSSVNTTGIITAAKFVGDGSGLTNVSGGGGGASSRTTVSGITTAIPANGIGNTEIAGFKTYGILKVGLSTAAWIRLYTDSVSRDNDAIRPISNDPSPGSGLVAEVASSGLSTIRITPFVIGFNDDNPVTNTIYISIKNLSGITTNVSFDLTILKLEE